jgi:hypothetical protein
MGRAEVLAALARGDEVDPAKVFLSHGDALRDRGAGLEWLNKTHRAGERRKKSAASAAERVPGVVTARAMRV